ncbi:type II toxin-antitoxin system RelE family toxin [Hydrogenimonas urashimensis]|uniref:type II toxin-antitoxin system RelE family toxin n=1 Tax=Hydrogenimonas urashimensis TaxID=2740515 RepID=UPI0019155648|nr:type II toxin-antitoxin system RelE/ParE family toxin [Hydrogenimonas urashimensis]
MYKVLVPHSVFKELKKIDHKDLELVWKKIGQLEKGEFSGDKPLKGKYRGKFRKRAGNYRIIYVREEDVLIITLVRVAHRKEVY